MVKEKLDGWLDNVKAPIKLSELKGKVNKIMEPQEVQTKEWGKRKIIEFIIEGKEGEVIVTEFLPRQFPIISPTSNLGKIMTKYECLCLRDLIGKEVELVEGKQERLKIKKE